MFWTWAAKAASLNALGAVAGAGVIVIRGFVGVGCSKAVGEDRRLDDNDNDVGAIMGKYACEFDALIVLGCGPKGDVDVPGVVIAVSVEGSGII